MLETHPCDPQTDGQIAYLLLLFFGGGIITQCAVYIIMEYTFFIIIYQSDHQDSTL